MCKAIAEIAHKYEIPLIVDEAHGAHFHFSNYFPAISSRTGSRCSNPEFSQDAAFYDTDCSSS